MLYARYVPVILGGGGSGSAGITSINGDTTTAQFLVVGTAGTDFAIVDSGTGTHTFNLPTASATNRGALSSADWTTFNNKQNALTFGNLTDVGTDGIVVTGGTGAVIGTGTSLAQHVADTTHNGYLSSTDWNTFNNKQSTLTLTNLTDAGTDGITITNGTGVVIGSSPVTLSQHVADTTHNGYLSSADWNTFNGKGSGSVTSVSVVSANGFSGTVATATTTPAITLSTTVTGILQGNGTAISAATTGNLTDAGTDGITVTGGTGAILGSGTSLSQHVADTTHNGYLSSADWNTFNGKQSAFSGLNTDGVIYATSSTAVASTTVGTAGQVLTSNGAGVAPTFQAAPAARSVAAIVSQVGASYTANNVIVFTNVIKDTNSAYNNSTGEFTAPNTGYYQCNTIINTNDTTDSTIFVFVNGANFIAIGANTGGGNIIGSGIVFATAGQTIDFRYAHGWSAVGATQTSMSIAQVA